MTIETLNLGEEVSARLLTKEIITGRIDHIRVETYNPGNGYSNVVKIYYTLRYITIFGQEKELIVREYEIINNEKK